MSIREVRVDIKTNVDDVKKQITALEKQILALAKKSVELNLGTDNFDKDLALINKQIRELTKQKNIIELAADTAGADKALAMLAKETRLATEPSKKVVTADVSEALKGLMALNDKVNNVGKNFGRMFGAGGAVFTGMRAARSIMSEVGNAIGRMDTMNNFPRVMESIGQSAQSAENAIQQLQSELQGLPTALNDGVAGVQRLTGVSNDVGLATEQFLALNNAVIAGGQPVFRQAQALQQFIGIVSSGQPIMQRWSTLLDVMPAQLNQIATQMGYANEEVLRQSLAAQDSATSMEDLLDAVVHLNRVGLDGFATFEQQARMASDGVTTGVANARIAIQRGIVEILEGLNTSFENTEFGNLAGFIGRVGSVAERALGGLASALGSGGNGLVAMLESAYHALMRFDFVEFFASLGAAIDTFIGIVRGAWSMAEPLLVGLATFAGNGDIAVGLGRIAGFLFLTSKALNAVALAKPLGAVLTGLSSLVAFTPKLAGLSAVIGTLGTAWGAAGLGYLAILGYGAYRAGSEGLALSQSLARATVGVFNPEMAAEMPRHDSYSRRRAVERAREQLNTMELGLSIDTGDAAQDLENLKANIESLEATLAATYEHGYQPGVGFNDATQEVVDNIKYRVEVARNALPQFEAEADAVLQRMHARGMEMEARAEHMIAQAGIANAISVLGADGIATIDNMIESIAEFGVAVFSGAERIGSGFAEINQYLGGFDEYGNRLVESLRWTAENSDQFFGAMGDNLRYNIDQQAEWLATLENIAYVYGENTRRHFEQYGVGFLEPLRHELEQGGENIARISGYVEGQASDLAGAFTSQFEGVDTEIAKVFGDMSEQVLGAMEDNFNPEEWTALAVGALDSLVSGFADATSLETATTEVAQSGINGIKDTWEQNSPSQVFLDLGEGAINSLADGIVNASPAVEEAINNIVEIVVTAMDSISESINNSMIEMESSLVMEAQVQAVVNEAERVIEVLRGFAEGTDDLNWSKTLTDFTRRFAQFMSNLEGLNTNFHEIGDSYKEAFLDGINMDYITQKIISDVEALIGLLEGKIGRLGEIGRMWGEALLKGFQAAIARLPNIAAQVIQAISGLGGLASSIGGGLGQSLASGFQSATANIASNLQAQLNSISVPNIGGRVGGSANTQHRASGGMIFNPRGTDTVPAMLTPGEFVQKKSAVQLFSENFMRRVNACDVKGVYDSMIGRFGIPQSYQPNVSNIVNNINNDNKTVSLHTYGVQDPVGFTGRLTRYVT
ncbi:MAG: tape measure protein [Lachnospiraceae bacterium]|nr:tape measure protein [Lachnospiraceae bacterium]